MMDILGRLLAETGQPGLPQLRQLLADLLDGSQSTGGLVSQHELKRSVFRLKFKIDGVLLSFIVKRLDPDVAQRNRLVAERWLPAVGLKENGPALLGSTADITGRFVWHVYEDFGENALGKDKPDPEQVRAAVALIARLHTRFAEHPLLGECRLWGGDLGFHFYTSSVRDALRSIAAIRKSTLPFSSERLDLLDRLFSHLTKLVDEEPYRSQLLKELGGPETLLHGDLWTQNIFTIPTQNGIHVRLIDWDHAAVGPIAYDLSTFLYRFPVRDRVWILQLYKNSLVSHDWQLPAVPELNLLFETAECARIANRVIWPAIAVLDGQAAWGFEELAEVERWFRILEPVIV